MWLIETGTKDLNVIPTKYQKWPAFLGKGYIGGWAVSFVVNSRCKHFFQVIRAMGNKNRFEPIRTASGPEPNLAEPEPEPEVQSKVQ
jgi:hypothetical protein